jgi:hypothetical protein
LDILYLMEVPMSIFQQFQLLHPIGLGLSLLLFVTPQMVQAQESEIPLDASLISFSEATGQLEFEVFSLSETPIVAWHVSIVMRFSDGHELVSYFGSDYWIAGPDDYLEEGGSRRAIFGLQIGTEGQLADPPLELIPASVIFSDGRTLGDEELIDGLYRYRAGKLAEYCRVSNILRDIDIDASSVKGFRDSLQSAIETVNDAPVLTKSATTDCVGARGAAPISEARERFRVGSFDQRKISIEFLDSLIELLDSDSIENTQTAANRLRHEADRYVRYCDQGKSHLRETDLDLIQLATGTRSEGRRE